MRTGILLIILAAILSGCFRKPDRQDASLPGMGNRYASRFGIRDQGSLKVLTVSNPWQSASDQVFRYVLAERGTAIPDSLQSLPLIRIPLERVICMSTTHLAAIRQLGEGGSIAGASGVDHMYDPWLVQRAGEGLVKEVGFNQALNYETIVDLSPDVVFFYGVEGAVNTSAARLEDMGIRVVYCAEYLEPHPLGKAEWLRFFSAFYGKEDQAALFFHSVDSSYGALTRLAAGARNRPQVLTGLPWKDTWYVAGGRSYLASLIRDAGGHYLWEDHPSSEAIAMDIESVYSKALEADIWINPGIAGSLEELRSFDARFALLPALSAARVFNNNRRMGPGGGNDYWESGTLRPDLILSDLITAFHPELIPEHEFFFYKQLK